MYKSIIIRMSKGVCEGAGKGGGEGGGGVTSNFLHEDVLYGCFLEWLNVQYKASQSA